MFAIGIMRGQKFAFTQKIIRRQGRIAKEIGKRTSRVRDAKRAKPRVVQ